MHAWWQGNSTEGKQDIIMPLLQTLKNMKSQAMTKQNYFNTWRFDTFCRQCQI